MEKYFELKYWGEIIGFSVSVIIIIIYLIYILISYIRDKKNKRR